MSVKLYIAKESSVAASGVKMASLSVEVQLAIAVCSSIGVGATATRAKDSATSLLMQMAYDTQQEAGERFLETDDQEEYRDATWKKRMADVVTALHDAATQKRIADMHLHQHVGATRQTGSQALTGLQSLLAKASNAVESYNDMIVKGWKLGVTIVADDVRGIGSVPESYNKFRKRVADAVKAGIIVTEGAATASMIDKVSADIRVALLGTEKAPKVPDSGLCATLQSLFNGLNYLVLSASAGNDTAIAALADLADAAQSFAEHVGNTTPIVEDECTGADELPEGEDELPTPVEADPIREAVSA